MEEKAEPPHLRGLFSARTCSPKPCLSPWERWPSAARPEREICKPSQSASPTALPEGEPRGREKPCGILVGAATCRPLLPGYRYTDNRKDSFVPFLRKKGTPKTAKRRWAYAPSLGTHPQTDISANLCFLTLALWYLTDRAFAGGRQCLCGYHETSYAQNRSQRYCATL